MRIVSTKAGCRHRDEASLGAEPLSNRRTVLLDGFLKFTALLSLMHIVNVQAAGLGGNAMAHERWVTLLAVMVSLAAPASAESIEGWGSGFTLANAGNLTLDFSSYLNQGGQRYQINSAYLWAYAYSPAFAQFRCNCFLDLGTTQDVTYSPGALTLTTTHTYSYASYEDDGERFWGRIGDQLFSGLTGAQSYSFNWGQQGDYTTFLFTDPDGLFGYDGPLNVYARSITHNVASVGGRWGWAGDEAWLDSANLASINDTGKLTIDYTASYAPGYSPGFSASFARVYFSLTALPGSAPEPSSWMMLVTGFGFVGHGLRARRAAGKSDAISTAC